jgi:hypothetical protein
VIATIDLSRSGYDNDRGRRFYETLQQRLAGVPGLTAVALGRSVPVQSGGIATTAVRLAALGVVASVVLPLVPAWPFTLLEHFRFQYLWAALPLVVACGARGLRGWFDAALIATLVNALCGDKVAITSNVPNTTRRRIFGVANGPDFQLVLADLPGFQRPMDALTSNTGQGF